MKKQIEVLYDLNNEDLDVFLKNLEKPGEFISNFNKVLKEMSKNDRSKYFDNQTQIIIASLIQYYGDTHVKEILNLLAGLDSMLFEYIHQTVHLNLFEYLTNHLNVIKELNDSELYFLIIRAYQNNNKDIFGENLISSIGTQGLGYSRNYFFNELYSFFERNHKEFRKKFRLQIDMYKYNSELVAKKLGIPVELGKHLDEIHIKEKKRLEESRKNWSLRDDYLRTYEDTKEYREALELFALQINKVIQKLYPNIKVYVGTFFEGRTDVDTDFFITFETTMSLESNYQINKTNLNKILQEFSQLEKTLFNYDFINDGFKEFAEDIKLLPSA